MARYIDADALMKELEREIELADDWKTAHEIANVVKYFPTTEPEPKHAHWVKAERRGCVVYHDSYAECSNCHGEPIFLGRWFKYCPNCGAKMDEKENENDNTL